MYFLAKIFEISLVNAEITAITAILLTFSWHYFFVQGKYYIGLPILLAALFALGYIGGILSWLSGLGGDSFIEASSFNITEALVWISAFFSSLPQMLLPLSKASLLITVESLGLSIILYFIIWWRPAVFHGLITLLIAGIVHILYLGYIDFQIGRAYITDLRRQFDSNPSGFSATSDVDLFIYIGESTTSLNMSLYGYPLPTTPRLDKLSGGDEGFLRFDGVRSTHTHTSLSLLRAFSITLAGAHEYSTKWGIGNVLKQSGLKATLYSVQPLNGSFAAFSSFIFNGMNFDVPKEDRFKGNFIAPRTRDHQLLKRALEDSGIVFFHSYAGHAEYLNLIDTALSQKVNKPDIRFDGLYGSRFSETFNTGLPINSSAYDQAITYIDRNVSYAIESIKLRKNPAALIYFSDHGEAVYAHRGHDSSNFINEMSTIPMVLYFNEAYRTKYPEIYSMYRKAAQSRRTRLLDQVSPTILEIIQVRSNSPLDVPTLASQLRHPRPYILERQTVNGASRINLDYSETTGFSKADFVGGTPDATYISIINEKFSDENTICYHRADSFAKALRAAAVTSCLEFDLMVDGDELNVYHPPATKTGFQIEHIFRISQARKNSLWIDSKNLDDPKACNKLATYLEHNHRRVGKILIEFPGTAIGKLGDLRSCASRLKGIGALRSYYVPTHLLLPCAEDPSKNVSACIELDDNVQRAMASEIFSDLSFDFLGYSAMKRIPGSDKYKWNTWTIKAEDFHMFPRKDFHYIIMDTSQDPNTY